MPNWSWIAAAQQGTSHVKTGTRLQDAYRCFSSGKKGAGYLCLVISDGAGTAQFGGQGASIVCRKIAVAARCHFQKLCTIPDDSTLESWIAEARHSIMHAATKRGLRPRDFAATTLAVISSGNATAIAHIGDGCAVLKDEHTGEWFAPIWPAHGEYAATTNFITDESSLQLRIIRDNNPISAVVMFSDGLERLALDFQQQKPFHGFLEGVIKPLMQGDSNGKHSLLSVALKSYLNSEAINSRTDDDKSLIIAVRK
jgi:hypothetical protein